MVSLVSFSQVHLHEVCIAEGVVGESPLCLLPVLLVFLTKHRLYPCVVDLMCTLVAWLKTVDPSHQELISVFISWNIERRRPDTEIRVRTPRNRTSWYRLLLEAIILLSGSGAGEEECSARVRSARQRGSWQCGDVHRDSSCLRRHRKNVSHDGDD